MTEMIYRLAEASDESDRGSFGIHRFSDTNSSSTGASSLTTRKRSSNKHVLAHRSMNARHGLVMVNYKARRDNLITFCNRAADGTMLLGFPRDNRDPWLINKVMCSRYRIPGATWLLTYLSINMAGEELFKKLSRSLNDPRFASCFSGMLPYYCGWRIVDSRQNICFNVSTGERQWVSKIMTV